MKGAAALVAASRHPRERALLALAMLVTVGGVLGVFRGTRSLETLQATAVRLKQGS